MPGLALAEEALAELHNSLLHHNDLDEGDLLFYRINYRLAELLQIPAADASRLHDEYHLKRPRKVSKGFCEQCNRVVTLVPIIYGSAEPELAHLLAKQEQGRLIIGNTSTIREGNRVALFGCGSCRGPLPQYGRG